MTSPEAVTSPQPPSFDDEMLELINEYFYGVRIFPGQDLDGTYVGWVRFHSLLLVENQNSSFSQVTTQYHLHTDDFSQDCVRSCTVQRLDNYGGISESVDRQSCYLMRVDEMYAEVSNKSFKFLILYLT